MLVEFGLAEPWLLFASIFDELNFCSIPEVPEILKTSEASAEIDSFIFAALEKRSVPETWNLVLNKLPRVNSSVLLTGIWPRLKLLSFCRIVFNPEIPFRLIISSAGSDGAVTGIERF